jgi:hypothetical protein
MGKNAAGHRANGGKVGGSKKIGKPNNRSFEQRTGNPAGGRPSAGFVPQARKFRRHA